MERKVDKNNFAKWISTSLWQSNSSGREGGRCTQVGLNI